MKLGLFLFSILLLFARVAFPQQGMAEKGYFPENYHGDTWTGEVTAANDETREITLTYSKSGKTQTFLGVIEEGYTLKLSDGSLRELKPSKIRPGTVLKVYYITQQTKVSGKKSKVSIIFNIAGYPNHKIRHVRFMSFVTN